MSPGSSRPAAAWPWRDPMFLSGAVLLALVPLLAAAAGLDERTLFGRSPWDKPLRFALSLGVYATTMAIVAHWLLARTRILGWRWLSPVLIGFMVFEMTWIAVQAARGVDSHFNERTPFEAVMFSLMGIGAAVLSLGVLWLGLAASRLVLAATAPGTRVIALGVGLGFVGTGLLLPWTGEALVDAGRSQSAVEAVAVMPVLGWRLDGSDPRPAHFVAAHLMQALPLLALWLARPSGKGRQSGAEGLLVGLAAGGVLTTLWLMP
ncbi:MAG: hypothetical protein ACK50F_15025 [Betaproteobacteria bacterium]